MLYEAEEEETVPEEEEQEKILQQTKKAASQVKKVSLQGKICKKKKPQTTFAIRFQILLKERQEKECFTCEKKACTKCRKTPEEIFQTRQKLWAKALQTEEALQLQEKVQKAWKEGGQSGKQENQ